MRERARQTRRDMAAAPATTVLIGVNLLAYVAALAVPSVMTQFSIVGEAWRLNGQLYSLDLPGSVPAGVTHGEWYRLLTGNFLHAKPTEGTFGLLHIVFNMLWLWVLGRILEPLLGKVQFVALYLVSAMAGAALCVALAPDRLFIGASGAIYGLVAAYLVLSRRFAFNQEHAKRLGIYMAIWLVISAQVSGWQGHLGGAIAGAALAAAVPHLPVRPDRIVGRSAGDEG